MALTPMHTIEELWKLHHPEKGYPSGVMAVPEPINGLAFFPGGYGLWGVSKERPLPAFPVGGIMIIGHDFHSEEGYRISLAMGGERLTLPTWRNLLKILEDTGIRPERCFFTNLYMGLRAGKTTTGPFPGAKDDEFVKHCLEFLLDQIQAQRPSLVISLGMQVPPALSVISPELESWGSGRGLRHIDKVGAVKHGVTFEKIEDYKTTVVALLHPSLRHANLRHRRYGNTSGSDAELAMLRDGIAATDVLKS